MRLSDLDIIVIPGWSGSDAGHWQRRWAENFKTARLLEQDNWYTPDREAWVGRISEAVTASSRPSLLIAHSLGVIATVLALDALGTTAGQHVHGAFLVAPADVERADRWPVTQGHTFADQGVAFSPIPTATLPIDSVLIASATDPYCSEPRALSFAKAWGSRFVPAGDAGHINIASGHGPWPEGLMRLGWFLKQIETGQGTRH